MQQQNIIDLADAITGRMVALKAAMLRNDYSTALIIHGVAKDLLATQEALLKSNV